MVKDTAFFLYENVHQRADTASSRIRGKWLLKYWPEAEEFVYGKKYKTVIFQKVYPFKYAHYFDGIKILDMCDPDWLERNPVKEMWEEVDAITVSTKALQEIIQSMTDTPVVLIRDRQDLEYFKEKKLHRGRAKEAVWYGYSHNSHVVKSCLYALERYGLGLSIISDSKVSFAPYSERKGEERIKERWTAWELETVNKEIIKSDMVLMPGSTKPNDRFKSDNKTTNAWVLGMPVAKTAQDVRRFLDPDERKKEAERNLKLVKEKYDCRISVDEMKNLIKRLRNDKT